MKHGDDKRKLSSAVSAWVILQAAAMAYLRGGNTLPHPVSRYMDILALGALANFFAILLLMKEIPQSTAARQTGIVFATCWITALAAGSILISQHELGSRAVRTQSLSAIEETVRAYVATGDRKHLEGNPPTDDTVPESLAPGHASGRPDDPKHFTRGGACSIAS